MPHGGEADAKTNNSLRGISSALCNQGFLRMDGDTPVL
jgi:hypothetical protein